MAALVNVHGSLTTTTGTHQIAFTPAVGELLVVFTINTGNTTTPTVTDDQGGTYTHRDSALKATSADKMSAFVRDTLVTSAVAHTVSEAPGVSSGGGLLVARISGMQKVGAAAIRTSGKQENQAAAGTPAPVFTQAPLTTNLVLGAVGNGTNPATMTAPASWSERLDAGYATPATGLEVATRDSGETGTTITWGGTSATEFCAIILELDVSVTTAQTLAVTGTFTVTAVRQMGKPLAQAVTFTASVQRVLLRTLAVAVTFTVSVVKQAGKLLAQSVTFTVLVARRMSKLVAPTVTFATSMTRQTGKTLAGAVTWAASLGKQMAKALAATVTFTAGLTWARVILRNLVVRMELSRKWQSAVSGLKWTTDALLKWHRGGPEV